jgi:hypothetical protein
MVEPVVIVGGYDDDDGNDDGNDRAVVGIPTLD